MTAASFRRIRAAAGVAAILTPLAGHGVTLEPVERPRMDHYESSVQAQIGTAHDALDELLSRSDAGRASLTRFFGHVGQLYLLYDFMAPAAAALRNARSLAPDDPRWPYYLAIRHRHEGDLEGALEALNAVIALGPDLMPGPAFAAALLHRADLGLEMGRIEDAEADWTRVLAANPASSAAQLGLGRIAFERGDFEGAATRFATALRGQPPGSVAHHHLGLALRRLGRRAEAAAQLAMNEHVAIRFADPLFSELQQLNVSREAHIKRGTAAMRQGRPDAALAAFLDALEALPDDPLTVFNVAMALIELGEKEQAEARLRQSIAMNDAYRDPHYNLALILAERNDLKGAERHFRRAAEIDPDDVEARVRHADVLTRLDRATEAVVLLEQVVEVDPAATLAQLALGAAHQAAGAAQPARAALRRVLEAAPGAVAERAEAHYRLAVLGAGRAPEPAESGAPDRDAAESREGDDALTHLRQALALDPDLAEAHAFLGNLLARDEQYAEAANHFGRALVRDPGNLHWHRDRAMALILGGRYSAARSGLVSARRLRPGDLDGPLSAMDHLDTLLARLLAASPDPGVRNGPEALRIARRLLDLRPSIDHAETVAMALAEIGEFGQATTLQQQAIDEVRRRGRVPTAGQSQRLRDYRNGLPAREPWFSP